MHRTVGLTDERIRVGIGLIAPLICCVVFRGIGISWK